MCGRQAAVPGRQESDEVYTEWGGGWGANQEQSHILCSVTGRHKTRYLLIYAAVPFKKSYLPDSPLITVQRHEQHNNSGKSGRYHIVAGDVEEVLEVLVSTSKQGPHRTGAFVDVLSLPLTSVVTQEGAVKTRVSVLHQLDLNT